MEGRGDSGLWNRSERGRGQGGEGDTVSSGTEVRGAGEGKGDSVLGNRSERGRGWRGEGDSVLWNRSERGQGWRGGETVASGTGVRGGG